MTEEISRLASWAGTLELEQVPDDVLELCRAQRRSVLGAIAASSMSEAAHRVMTGVASSASEGPAPLIGADRTARVEDALYAAAAWSAALDFDDYMCFGHTGHTAVLVPLLLSAETEADGTTQLVAQVAANEIAARLGGACLIGPLNGQMWSHIHAAGAAIAAARVLNLDEARTAHALAIALHHPPRPTVPGFFGPDTKLLIASESAAAGLRAARLAAAGTTGPLDVLDHRSGFMRAFSFAPLRGMLSELGESWATRTLCVKARPGCAYIHTALEALFQLGPPDASDVRTVTVRAGLLTCGMEELSAAYRQAPTPVTVTFSIALALATALISGSFGPEELTDAFLRDARSDLLEVARRVRLVHDPELTRRGSVAFAQVVPPRAMLGDVGRGRLARGLRLMRAENKSVALSPLDALRVVRNLRGVPAPDGYWDEPALGRFRMVLPSRVEMKLGDGLRSAEVEVPLGAAGHVHVGPRSAAKTKLAEHGPRLWTATEKIDAAIEADATDLVALL